MTTYAVDFETTYDKKRDIRSLGVVGYLAHPETDAYLVSVVGDDGYEWVGHPKDADWQRVMSGKIVMHNAAFDLAVVDELRRRGLDIPQPAGGHDCTADMAAYLQAPRSLKDACRELLGVHISKSTRDDMSGKSWSDMGAEFRKEVCEYALNDSRKCLELWQKHSHGWPEHEREYSRHTAKMCRRGIGLDVARCEAGLARLHEISREASLRVPWFGELDAKGEPLTINAKKPLIAECAKRGIVPPASTDVKSDVWQEWLDQYEQHADFIKAIQTYRKAHRLEGVLQAMLIRRIGDRLPYNLRYAGAPHTLRWAGGDSRDENDKSEGGLNMHNLPKEPFEGVNARALLVPRPGYVLLAPDFSQIEFRVTLWFGGNKAVLDKLREGLDPYEAYARANCNYNDPRPLAEVDKALRQRVKGIALGLGFGMGEERYSPLRKISLEQAKAEKDDFRSKNRGVVACWHRLQQGLKQSLGDGLCQVGTPSGDVINYFQVASTAEGITGQVVRGDKRRRLWGSLLFQNLVQRTARNIMARAAVRIESAGIPVVLHVHDEIVPEVPEAEAKDAIGAITEIMQDVPPWAEGLPLAIDMGPIRREYGK